MGTARDKASAVGEAFRTREELLDQAAAPGGEEGHRVRCASEVVKLGGIGDEVKELLAAGLGEELLTAASWTR